MVDEDWWQSFYPDLFTGIQGACIDPERTAFEADMIERSLQLAPGSTILDAPCGNARLGVELARRGHRTTGVDLSEAILAQARARAGEAGVDLPLVRGDLRALPFAPTFDAVVCYWSSIGYFPEDQDQQMFRGLVSALRPGGRLAIETHSLETLLPRLQPRGWSHVGDRLLIEERRFVPETCRVETAWTLVDGTERITRSSSIRLYTVRELRGRLEEVGCEDFRALDARTGEVYRGGSTRLLVTATRGG